MSRPVAIVLSALLTFFISAVVVEAAKITLEKHDKRVTVNLDGQLFTEYVTDNGPKPILWPIIGPTGAEMTRAYPMKEVAGEKQDHFHHRSLWFTHMEVNGVNFWAEAPTYKDPKKSASAISTLGKTVHRGFKKAEVVDGKAIITAENDWIGPDGKKVLEDQRTITLSADDTSRTIDFDIDLKASEGPVTFGDNKDGTFGVRVPTSMDVTSKLGGKITNSEGLTDETAWGKAARWCDYVGPVGNKTVGIAILNHPSSFRYPTTWHVRTYGLFCANPFGWHDFDPKSDVNGEFTLEAGKTMKFRYRVIFHNGDDKQADIEGAFKKYAAETK